jgi:hypothetical protein
VVNSRFVTIAFALLASACAEGLEGNWELRRGPTCLEGLGCVVPVTDHPHTIEYEGCDYEVTQFLGVEDDLGGLLTVKFRGLGSQQCQNTITRTYDLHVEERDKKERYDVGVDFVNYTRDLDCAVNEDDLDCLDDLDQDWVFERL